MLNQAITLGLLVVCWSLGSWMLGLTCVAVGAVAVLLKLHKCVFLGVYTLGTSALPRMPTKWYPALGTSQHLSKSASKGRCDKSIHAASELHYLTVTPLARAARGTRVVLLSVPDTPNHMYAMPLTLLGLSQQPLSAFIKRRIKHLAETIRVQVLWARIITALYLCMACIWLLIKPFRTNNNKIMVSRSRLVLNACALLICIMLSVRPLCALMPLLRHTTWVAAATYVSLGVLGMHVPQHTRQQRALLKLIVVSALCVLAVVAHAHAMASLQDCCRVPPEPQFVPPQPGASPNVTVCFAQPAPFPWGVPPQPQSPWPQCVRQFVYTDDIVSMTHSVTLLLALHALLVMCM